MKSLRRTVLSVGAVLALVIGVAAPAAAVTLTYSYSTATCQLNATGDAYRAIATNIGCAVVQARINWIDVGGTARTTYGGQMAYQSIATSSTTMVTGRAARAMIVVQGVDRWRPYQAY